MLTDDMKHRKWIHTFALSVLAGIAIGIGGIVYLSVQNRIAGALAFTVGLYTICVHGLNLFTGKAGYLVEKPVSNLLELSVIWCGNLFGTWLAAFGMLYTRMAGISKTATELCQTKLDDGIFGLFILAVFCGFLMFVSVDGYHSSKNPAILFIGVSVFILCGFEHCIADMFYISLAGLWSLQAFLRILIITGGNIAGAVLIPLAGKIQR